MKSEALNYRKIKLNELKIQLFGKISECRKKKTKLTNWVKCEIDSLVLADDIKLGSIKGINIGTETIFNGLCNKNYKIELFNKKNIAIPLVITFAGLTVNKTDVETLKKLKVNDYFSFIGIFDTKDFNGKFRKVYNIQKISDTKLVNKIKKLLCEQKSKDI